MSLFFKIFGGSSKTNVVDESRVVDIDGNTYKTVKIGNQLWMAENLNVEHYRNGDAIPQVQNGSKWANLKTGAWCYHENEIENGSKYGKLYNWYAVNDPRGLAPSGWHIPAKEDFKTLITSENDDGNALKAVGQGSGTSAGTITRGFSPLQTGFRHCVGMFASLGAATFYWSSTQTDATNVYSMKLGRSDSGIYYFNDDYSGKSYGFSVRCVED